MKVADGVAVLELDVVMMGQHNTIYPALIWDETTAILIDAGIPPGKSRRFAPGSRPWGFPGTGWPR